jgi:hypothetical protein
MLPESPTGLYWSIGGQARHLHHPERAPAHSLRAECSVLPGTQPNILLIGKKAETDAAVSVLLHASDRAPVEMKSCHRLPLHLPASGSVKTVVLTDVGALSPQDQEILNEWLVCACGNIQVVTTNATPLVPLVRSGAFLEALYYRLNVVYMEVRTH